MPAAHTRMSNLCPASWSRKVAGAGLSRQTPLAHMAEQDAALGLTCPTHGCYGHVRNEPEIKHFLQRPYPRHSAFFKQICESSKLNTIKTTNVIFPLCPNISFSEYTWKDLKNHFLLPSCGIWYTSGRPTCSQLCPLYLTVPDSTSTGMRKVLFHWSGPRISIDSSQKEKDKRSTNIWKKNA